MVQYERMAEHYESHRAPDDVCELSIQVVTRDAFDIAPEFQKRLKENVDETFEAKAYEFDGSDHADRIVVYTGGDRISIATLRDVAELYSMVTNYNRGNIPPNMSVKPLTNERTGDTVFAWLEFQLERKRPTAEVEQAIADKVGETTLTPKKPMGDDRKAVLFRENNYAYDKVRDIVNRANAINDAVSVDHIRLVCEHGGDMAR